MNRIYSLITFTLFVGLLVACTAPPPQIGEVTRIVVVTATPKPTPRPTTSPKASPGPVATPKVQIYWGYDTNQGERIDGDWFGTHIIELEVDITNLGPWVSIHTDVVCTQIGLWRGVTSETVHILPPDLDNVNIGTATLYVVGPPDVCKKMTLYIWNENQTWEYFVEEE